MKICDHLNQFGELFNKTKSKNKSANLSELTVQMVKGTISNLKFGLMEEELKKYWKRKTEDNFHTQHNS